MWVVVAPDSFKGCLTAAEAAAAIAVGVRRAVPAAEVREIPMADGGEGTLDCFVDALGAERVTMSATGPLGAPTPASYAVAGERAVVELASASGLPLLTVAELDAPRATTRGTGELIRAAIDGGAREVLLCLGGSATTDGGTGLMRALGYRFLGAEGAELPEGGGALTELERIDDADVPEAVRATRFRLACDVAHPLVGPSGAAAVFGPQKGADAEQVTLLDAALTRLADVLAEKYGVRVHDLPGAGAAGGAPAGLVAALGAEMSPGGRLVAETVGLSVALADQPDLVLTGEGRLDDQSAHGKVVSTVAALAGGVPVVALAGSLRGDLTDLHKGGLTAAFSLADGPSTLDELLAEAAPLLTGLAEQVTRTFTARHG